MTQTQQTPQRQAETGEKSGCCCGGHGHAGKSDAPDAKPAEKAGGGCCGGH